MHCVSRSSAGAAVSAFRSVGVGNPHPPLGGSEELWGHRLPCGSASSYDGHRHTPLLLRGMEVSKVRSLWPQIRASKGRLSESAGMVSPYCCLLQTPAALGVSAARWVALKGISRLCPPRDPPAAEE